MFYGQFEHITELQYRVKSLTARVRAYESGEKYKSIEAANKARLCEKDRETRNLLIELGDANARAVTIRKNYQQVIEDMEKEHKKGLAEKDREIERWKARAFKAEGKFDAMADKLTEKNRELYQVRTELEEEQGKNQLLKAHINRDYENSSVPSSSKPKRKKITNNREKTGRRPGGQFGHKGRPRKRHIPDRIIQIPAQEKYLDSTVYKPTGKTIVKQMIGLSIGVTCEEYATPEFRLLRTGQRVHTDFPEGAVDDVNYDGTIKAFTFLLNNYCNVAVKKVSDFLSELTGGELKISTGMISGLSKEFSLKTEADQKKAFADMLLAPVINTDFTSARVDGRNVNVIVCATPKSVLYFQREHKGHEGVKGTPVEEYQGVLVHDHDKTFYNYGTGHQECLDHPLRYLKASMENEPELKWNKLMWELLREMIHFRNGLAPDDDRNPDQIDAGRVNELEARYDEILALARKEYEYEPPTKYNKDGFNLYKRLFDYKDNHLLFLHDIRVPHSNSLAERLLRLYKRKQQQAMAFRSAYGLHYLCNSLGVIASLRANNNNLFESVASIFNRQIPRNDKVAC